MAGEAGGRPNVARATSVLHVRTTSPSRPHNMIRNTLLLAVTAAASAGAQAQRPMTFLDAQNMRQVSGQDLSPDGRQMLYVLSTPDWANARRQSDVYLVSTDRGLPSTR